MKKVATKEITWDFSPQRLPCICGAQATHQVTYRDGDGDRSQVVTNLCRGCSKKDYYEVFPFAKNHKRAKNTALQRLILEMKTLRERIATLPDNDPGIELAFLRLEQVNAQVVRITGNDK